MSHNIYGKTLWITNPAKLFSEHWLHQINASLLTFLRLIISESSQYLLSCQRASRGLLMQAVREFTNEQSIQGGEGFI